MLTYNMLDHPNFIGLSKNAKLIFIMIKAQYRGFNNGDLAATLNMAKAKCFCSSSSMLNKALKELEDKGFIYKTRQGGKNKCSLFAITTDSIDDCNGKIDFMPTKVASNDWKKQPQVNT